MTRIVFGLILVNMIAISAIAQQPEARWPQFRGPGGQGVAVEGMKLPTTFGPDKNILWQTHLPHGHSSPVVWDDRIYVTVGDRKTKILETICLDRKSGKVVWRKEIIAKTIEQLYPLNGPATPTPATDGERLYVYFGSHGLACYDLDGVEKWHKPLKPLPTSFGSGSSPVVAAGRVLLNTGSAAKLSLLAFDAKTGDLVWQKDRDRAGATGVWSTPAVRACEGGYEVIVGGGAKVAAYNVADGAERWQLTGFPNVSLNTPALADGLACFTLTNHIGDPENVVKLPMFAEALKKYDTDKDGKIAILEIPKEAMTFGRGRADKIGEWNPLRSVVAFFDHNKDKALDEKEWTELTNYMAKMSASLQVSAVCIELDGKTPTKNVVWQQTKSVPEVPSPLFYQGRAYLLSEKGFLTCRDLKTGKELYKERLQMRGTVYSSPVAGDGKIYAACDRGTLVVLKAGDRFEVLATAEFNEPIVATPALVDGRIYLRTERRLFAFGE